MVDPESTPFNQSCGPKCGSGPGLGSSAVFLALGIRTLHDSPWRHSWEWWETREVSPWHGACLAFCTPRRSWGGRLAGQLERPHLIRGSPASTDTLRLQRHPPHPQIPSAGLVWPEGNRSFKTWISPSWTVWTQNTPSKDSPYWFAAVCVKPGTFCNPGVQRWPQQRLNFPWVLELDLSWFKANKVISISPLIGSLRFILSIRYNS